MSVVEVMIADDHSMFREGLRQLLEKNTEIHVMAEAENGIKCLKLLSELSPDILILNIDMPDKNGFDVLSELSQEHRQNLKIIILTGHSGAAYIMKAMGYQIHGYVLKTSDFTELLNAIQAVRKDEVYIQQELKDKIGTADMDASFGNDMDRIESLTMREMDVLKLLSVGMYNKEIALKLGISERTVKNHISNIFKKIGVADRTQAAVFAIRNYLVDIFSKG